MRGSICSSTKMLMEIKKKKAYLTQILCVGLVSNWMVASLFDEKDNKANFHNHMYNILNLSKGSLNLQYFNC